MFRLPLQLPRCRGRSCSRRCCRFSHSIPGRPTRERLSAAGAGGSRAAELQRTFSSCLFGAEFGKGAVPQHGAALLGKTPSPCAAVRRWKHFPRQPSPLRHRQHSSSRPHLAPAAVPSWGKGSRERERSRRRHGEIPVPGSLSASLRISQAAAVSCDLLSPVCGTDPFSADRAQPVPGPEPLPAQGTPRDTGGNTAQTSLSAFFPEFCKTVLNYSDQYTDQ